MIQGKYFSFTSASANAGTDLIEVAESLTGNSILAKKLSLVTSASIVNINSSSVNSTLYQDSDGLYRLSFDDNDCLVESLIIVGETGSPVFLSVIY